MWFMLPALLSAVGSIGSAKMGADAANQSQLYNYYADEYNRQQAEKERQESIQRSDRIRAEDMQRSDRIRREDRTQANQYRTEDIARQEAANTLQQIMANRIFQQQSAPVTDAQGNRTEYIEGVGWVSTPSETTRNLTNASNAEQMKRLTSDAAQTRRGRDENERRRITEGQTADAYRRQLAEPASLDRNTIRDLLVRAATAGQTEAFDRAQSVASRQALRTGTSGADVVSALARKRADAATDASVNAELQSLGISEQLAGQRDSRLSQLYNLFAQRAANVEDTPFQPVGYTGNDTVQGIRGGSSNAGMAMVSSAGRAPQSNITAPTGAMGVGTLGVNSSGGRASPQATNNANALAFGSVFDSIGGMANAYYQKNQYDDLMSVLQNRQRSNTGGGW